MVRSSGCNSRRLFPVAICCFLLLFSSVDALLAQDDDPGKTPSILLFRVLSTIDEGVQWHEFHWQVANTDRVKLFQDGAEIGGRSQRSDGTIGWPLSMSGGMRMRLKASTTFELIAEGADGSSVSKSQVAEVRATPTKPPKRPPGKSPGTPPGTPPGKPPGKSPGKPPGKPVSPSITLFRVSPAMAEPGGEIKFFWEVEHAQSIRLFEGDHEIDLRGIEDTLSTGGVAAFLTTIDETTTFRLEASDRTRRATSKSFTVKVEDADEPTAKCSIRGQLRGKWRQEVKEHPTGPASTWTVAVYAYVAGADRPVGQASVDSRGIYRVSDLVAGKSYRLRPNWDSIPRDVNVSCSAGQTREGPGINITGGPLLD